MFNTSVVVKLLVLLFSMCGAQSLSIQTEVHSESQSSGAAAEKDVPNLLDVSAELTQLRDLVENLGNVVMELRVELQHSKSQLEKAEATMVDLQVKNAVMENNMMNLIKTSAGLEAELAAVKSRLAVSETEVENLKGENTAVEAELTATRSEMMNLIKTSVAQETDMVTMKNDVLDLLKTSAALDAELTVLKTRFNISEAQVESLKVENSVQGADLSAVRDDLTATVTEVENLRRDMTAHPKVAFSAALSPTGYTESGNTEITLVFSEIITNVGQAYSSVTGFFTAPVKGVYYFRFTVMDVLSNRFFVIKMFKNGKQIMYLYDHGTDGYPSYMSSSLILELEVGDVVNLGIPPNERLFNDDSNYSTFTGFLLYNL